MAIARVGSSLFSESAAVTTRQLSITPTIGNLLVVGFSAGSFSANLSIDDGVHTWSVANAVAHDSSNSISSASWYTIATTNSPITVTCTSTISQFCIMTLEEFSGVDTTSPLDKNVRSADAASGTPISPSFTPAFDNELVWAWAADSLTAVGNIDGSAATAGSNGPSYTNGDGSEFRVLTGRSGVAMTAAFTGSGVFTVMVATFKEAVAGDLTPSPGAGVLGMAGRLVALFIEEVKNARLIIRKS